MKIGFDIDDVVCDFLEATIIYYNEIYKDNQITINDFTNFDIFNCPKIKFSNKIIEIWKKSDFYSIAKPKKDSQKVISFLQKKHEIFLVSNTMSYPEAMSSKVNWIKEYFPKINLKQVIFLYDKSLIDIDVLIDDGVHNLKGAKHFKPYLFDAPHNKKETEFYRFNTFLEIKNYFM